jgi:hypothetical protein
MDNKDLMKFVRKTLGCTCPDEILKRIEYQTGVGIEDDLLLDYEINVGNRLLIYVVRTDETDSLSFILSRLVRLGMHKRNRDGFNRLRLVLLTQRPTLLAKEASGIFQSFDTTDEKVHLHVVDTKDFPTSQDRYRHKYS